MAKQLPYIYDEIKKVLAYRVTSVIEDIVDGTNTISNKLSVIGGTEYRLTIGTPIRHFKNGFNTETGVSMIFDINNDKSVFNEIFDTPIVLTLPSCIFQPSSANAGECIIRCYVDETTPILHDQAIVSYKGQVPEKMGDIFQFYLGDEIGYQLKTKGVYFTFEFDHNGQIWDKSLLQNIV